jgi:hypothetical protein
MNDPKETSLLFQMKFDFLMNYVLNRAGALGADEFDGPLSAMRAIEAWEVILEEMRKTSV